MTGAGWGRCSAACTPHRGASRPAYPVARTSRFRDAAALEQALAQLDTPWDHGPFAEPARASLRAHAGRVRDRLHAYDQLAGRVRDAPGPWVVTHGEPHGSNVILGAAGDRWLVDWDTTLIGPRERDLWMVLDDDRTGWDEYREVMGSVP